MAVAALSTAGFSQYIAASSNLSASQQAWQSLEQSLALGNLTAAQSAFNTYNQLNQSSSTASGSGSSSSSQLATDMTALGSAIGSGDLSTAQSAFATVQNDLKTTPSQAMANAESAVAQTVQWVDDLLSLSDSSNSSSTPTDPATAILDSAYGMNPSSNTTDPTVALLESKYGDGNGSTGSASSSGASASASSGDSGSAPSVVSAGNAGSAASVNVYA
ncbi:MAG: hypothetical protein ABR924_10110 [Terracidiphilus sp.]|jgi:hypothetical protein